jgi:GT2 family glycosyltransferase
VLVTWNQLEFTRQCIDSIRENTEQEYELIVVDNASTDGTTEYLADCPDVLLIRNFENKGFPAAANQGIRLSRGRHVILLNNDTIVPRGWLAPLLDPFNRDARTGLVGPSSNCVSGLQQIESGYRNINELNKFANDLRIREKHRLEDVDRLIGFCMAIDRKVIDRIGLLDECFGIGCFEDDDYTLRSLEAGFRVVIARDAFVHHFGSRSFIALGDQFGSILESNRSKFLQKWPDRQPSRFVATNNTCSADQQNRILVLVDLRSFEQSDRHDLLARYHSLQNCADVVCFGPGMEGYRDAITIDEILSDVLQDRKPSWILHAPILGTSTQVLVSGLAECEIRKAIDLD